MADTSIKLSGTYDSIEAYNILEEMREMSTDYEEIKEEAEAAASAATAAVTTAQTAANNASTYADNAQTYAGNANTSAGEAAGYASNASTSATNAATSETNASNSASAAATSEANAATSETNAGNSATAASGSASAAAASAAEVEAALDDYLPLAGGTMTGAIKGNPITLTADNGNNEVSLVGKADFGLMWNNVPISLPDGTYDLDFYGFGYITSGATALDITFPYICRNKDILFNSLSAILRSYKGYLSPGGTGGGDILTGSTQGTWYKKNTAPFPMFRLVRSGGWGTNGENNTLVVGEFSANVTVTTVV